MKSSESLAQIAPALVKALGELKAVVKDSKNPHFKNDYASLEAVTETARPVLAQHGLAFMQGLGEYANGAMTVSTRIIHESGEWIESDFQMPVGKADPQGTASASTYGRRYSLMGILGLAPTDDDGEAAMAPRQQAFERKSNGPGIPSGLNVSPEGNDWWGASAVVTASSAKKDGLDELFDTFRHQITDLHTAQGWRDWCAENSDDIKRMPRDWRITLRNEAEAQAAEIGFDPNQRK